MKIPEEILNIAGYISSRYDEPLTPGGDLTKEVILNTIKEFSGFEYDDKHSFFIRDIDKVQFATENVELENITNLYDLHKAISYLQEAYEKRKAQQQVTRISLREDLFTPPQEIQPISRGNIMSYIKQQYDINNEKELFQMDETAHKNVIYDLYKNFTGYIPLKEHPNHIVYTSPDQSDINFSYSNIPDFKHDTSLLSHLRTMRNIKKNTQKSIQEMTPQRLESLKKFADDRKKQHDNQQEVQ